MFETRNTRLRGILSVASPKLLLSICRVSRETVFHPIQQRYFIATYRTSFSRQRSFHSERAPCSTQETYSMAVRLGSERRRTQSTSPYHRTGRTLVKLTDTHLKASLRPRRRFESRHFLKFLEFFFSRATIPVFYCRWCFCACRWGSRLLVSPFGTLRNLELGFPPHPFLLSASLFDFWARFNTFGGW